MAFKPVISHNELGIPTVGYDAPVIRRNSQVIYSTTRPPSIVYSDCPSELSLGRGRNQGSSFKYQIGPPIPPKLNGDINQYDVVTKPVLSDSHPSLNSKDDFKVSLYGAELGVDKSLISLALMAVCSLVLSLLSVLFLFKLGAMQENRPLSNTVSDVRNTAQNQRKLVTSSSFENVLIVCIALCSFVLMLNLCCFLVCAMQCFYLAKILKTPHGEERAFKYLKECNNSRFLAATGLFLSIPISIIAIILFMLMALDTVSAIIGAVLMAIGIIFCLFSMVHDTYFWWQEKKRANNNQPVYDNPALLMEDGAFITKKELSTLV